MGLPRQSRRSCGVLVAHLLHAHDVAVLQLVAVVRRGEALTGHHFRRFADGPARIGCIPSTWLCAMTLPEHHKNALKDTEHSLQECLG